MCGFVLRTAAVTDRSGHAQPERPNDTNATNDTNRATALLKPPYSCHSWHSCHSPFRLSVAPAGGCDKKKERGISFLAPRSSFLVRSYCASTEATSIGADTAWSSDATSTAR